MQSMSLTYLLNQRALYLLHVGYRQVIHAIKNWANVSDMANLQLKLSVNDTFFPPLSFSVCM